jgi:hypothetical protein
MQFWRLVPFVLEKNSRLVVLCSVLRGQWERSYKLDITFKFAVSRKFSISGDCDSYIWLKNMKS